MLAYGLMIIVGFAFLSLAYDRRQERAARKRINELRDEYFAQLDETIDNPLKRSRLKAVFDSEVRATWRENGFRNPIPIEKWDNNYLSPDEMQTLGDTILQAIMKDNEVMQWAKATHSGNDWKAWYIAEITKMWHSGKWKSFFDKYGDLDTLINEVSEQ